MIILISWVKYAMTLINLSLAKLHNKELLPESRRDYLKVIILFNT